MSFDGSFKQGVAADRVDLLPLAPATSDHLATYGEMDISLDPWPYAGTTTTCESLFMGERVRRKWLGSFMQRCAVLNNFTQAPVRCRSCAVKRIVVLHPLCHGMQARGAGLLRFRNAKLCNLSQVCPASRWQAPATPTTSESAC